MPRFLFDQREWIDLTDDEVLFARLALDEVKGFPFPESRAIKIVKDCGITLKHAVCAVAYAQQNP